MKRFYPSMSNTVRFSSQHEWIDLETGRCGVMPSFVFSEYPPEKFRFVPYKCYQHNLSLHELVGVMSISEDHFQRNVALYSMAAGEVDKINLDWNCHGTEPLWTYQFKEIYDLSPYLLEFEDYLAHLQSLN
jgi:hypothetical protein